MPYDRGKKSCTAGADSALRHMWPALVHGLDRARVRWRRMVEQLVETSVFLCGKEIVDVVPIRPLERVQQVQRRARFAPQERV